MSNECSSLKENFEYYLKNQVELVQKYNGRYLAIKDCQVIGVYDSEIEAVEKTSATHELGTFLIQKCEPGKESYTQTYHSRAIFQNC